MRENGQGIVSARWSGSRDSRRSKWVSEERCEISRALASEGGMYVRAMKAIAQSAHKMEA